MIELVVFDMAGTTVEDTNAVGSCFRAALAAVGVKVLPAAVNAVMGLPRPEAVRCLLRAAERAYDDQEVALVHADFAERMKRYYATDPAVRELPGASELFARLREAGVKTALNTGFSREILDLLLKRLGWTSAVDATVASNEVPRGRPHPDMIFHLMRRLGVLDAARVAKVGDTPADLQEGTNAGCGLVLGVTTGSFPRAQLQGYAHTAILDSLMEVSRVLLQSASG